MSLCTLVVDIFNFIGYHVKMTFNRFLKIITAPLILLLALVLPQFANAQFGGPSNVKASLISERKDAVAGDVFHIALVQDINPEWHTYWRNPGDVGDPTRITWQAPQGIIIGDIKWPSPSQLPYGDFVNYGYSGHVVLPIEIKIPQNQAPGPVELKAQVEWLECKDICVPGQSDLSLVINIATAKNDSENSSEIKTTIAALPKAFVGQANYQIGETLNIGLAGDAAKNARTAYFYPYEVSAGALIDHAAPQIMEIGPNGLSLKLKKSPSFPKAELKNIGGVIQIDGEKTFTIDAQNAALPAGVSGHGPKLELDFAELGRASLLALLGGLILNLMPCVFPILAMKVFGLSKIAHGENNIARRYGLLYGLGVIATFAILGAMIFALKAYGAAIGWGFQLQNPIFLYLMVILIAAIGMNLLGLFEFGTSLQGIGANLAQKSGDSGAFLSGALAVAVASPCTAPFMAAALGYAAVQSPIIGLVVFLSLGIGFALPFVLLTFTPNALKFLPKPGKWMDVLKKILSIPMFLTAIWLMWVLSKVSGITMLANVIIVIAMMFTYFVSKSQGAAKLNQKISLYSLLLLIFLGLGTAFFVKPQNNMNASTAAVNHEIWSDAKVEEARAQGKIVFVNFTADWCITCKVNEKMVFENAKVQEAMKNNNVTYLVADWTNRDDEIARALSSHGRLGVPLYLIYQPANSEPVVLPQILTTQVVIDALEAK